jgi:hypothetical protein
VGDASDIDGASDVASEATHDAADGGSGQAIGIPMYFDPSQSPSDWALVEGEAPTVALLIANPASGPGTQADPTYTKAIADAHAAHQTVIGYVDTLYGQRPIAQTQADVDTWYTFYPALDGIFYDECSADASTIPGYYAPIHDYVKAKSGARVVVVNPGTMVDEAFMATADVVVTFEDTYASYTNGTYPPNPAWTSQYPPNRFWHMVHTTPDIASMQDAVAQSRTRGVGYVFVSDQPAATAYTQLPASAFWQTELAAVQAP